jgi:rubrerythrin
MEISVSPILSNLAKACEKQYKPREAELFAILADYFDSVDIVDSGDKAHLPIFKDFSELSKAIGANESSYLESIRQAAIESNDRGALRMATWGSKANAIRKSAVDRYEKKGEALLEDASIFVCEACGFIFLGKEAPEICPVCKAPAIKFSKQG